MGLNHTGIHWHILLPSSAASLGGTHSLPGGTESGEPGVSAGKGESLAWSCRDERSGQGGQGRRVQTEVPGFSRETPRDLGSKANSALCSLFLTPSSPLPPQTKVNRSYVRPVCFHQSWPCQRTGESCNWSGQDRSLAQTGGPFKGRRKSLRAASRPGGSTGFQALCPEDAKHIKKLASVERAEVLGVVVMSWCPGVGGRREGEGTRQGPGPLA